MSDTTTTKYGVYRQQSTIVYLGPYFDDWDSAQNFCHKRDLTGEGGWIVYEVAEPSSSYHLIQLREVDHRIYSTSITVLTVDGSGHYHGSCADDNDLG